MATSAPPPLTLEEAVQIASRDSPRIMAAHWQAQAARESAVAAAQPPDPVLKFGLNNLPIDGSERFQIGADSMTMRSIGAMQELTRRDKLQARSGRAQVEFDAATLAATQAQLEVQRDTALAWLERSYQVSLHELLIEQRQHADLQVQAAQTLAGSGKVSAADVFMARSQLAQLHDAVAQSQSAIEIARTRLARWIGAAAQRPGGARPILTLPHWALEANLSTHLARHIEVAMAAQHEAQALADVALAQAEQRPDWSVEVMLSQRGSRHSNMVSVNVSLPLAWNVPQRQGRDVATRQALAARSSAEREDRLRSHEAEVRAVLTEWRRFEARLQRIDNQWLPLAQQRSSAALAAYRGGHGPLTSVLDARRAEVDTRTERLRTEMELARVWAQLGFREAATSPPTSAPAPTTSRSSP